jgi:alanyl-tRNA synthetase
LGAPNQDLLQAISKVKAQLGELEGEVRSFRADSTRDSVEALLNTSRQRDGVSVVAAVVEVADMGQLLALVDSVRDRLSPSAVALGALLNGKGALVVSVSREVSGLDAGVVAREVARSFGGGGGGNAALGRAGGLDAAMLSDAVDTARQMLWEGF